MVGNFNFRSVKNHDASSWVRDFKSRVFSWYRWFCQAKLFMLRGIRWQNLHRLCLSNRSVTIILKWMSGWPSSEMETWWVHLVVIAQRLFSLPDTLAWVYREAVICACPHGCLLSQSVASGDFLPHILSAPAPLISFFRRLCRFLPLDSTPSLSFLWEAALFYVTTRRLPPLQVCKFTRKDRRKNELAKSHPHAFRCSRGLRSLGIGVTGGSETPDQGDGIWIQVLCKSSVCVPISWGVSPAPRQLFWSVQKPLLAGDFHEDMILS